MLGESREAILTARHIQFCRTPCTPIHRYFSHRAVCLPCICTSWSWNVSYHVIRSSLLCSPSASLVLLPLCCLHLQYEIHMKAWELSPRPACFPHPPLTTYLPPSCTFYWGCRISPTLTSPTHFLTPSLSSPPHFLPTSLFLIHSYTSHTTSHHTLCHTLLSHGSSSHTPPHIPPLTPTHSTYLTPTHLHAGVYEPWRKSNHFTWPRAWKNWTKRLPTTR